MIKSVAERIFTTNNGVKLKLEKETSVLNDRFRTVTEYSLLYRKTPILRHWKKVSKKMNQYTETQNVVVIQKKTPISEYSTVIHKNINQFFISINEKHISGEFNKKCGLIHSNITNIVDQKLSPMAKRILKLLK